MRFAKSSIFLAAALASANPIEKRIATEHYIFSFGDSYSQTGFNVTTGPLPSCTDPMGNPPFPGYTTDNGVNWIGEVVETAPNCTLNWNFAYGGATVNASLVAPYEPTVLSFIDQVAEFSNSVGTKPKGYKWTAANSVAVTWFGVNDVGNSWYESNQTTINTDDFGSFFGQLSILYKAGVRKFLLFTVPPTNRSPLFIASGTATVTGVKADIAKWNAELTAQSTAWAYANSGSTVDILETGPIFNHILNNPKKYGAPNATCYDADGTSCLWWNDYHPGQAIQKAVGSAAYGMLFGKGSLGLAED